MLGMTRTWANYLCRVPWTARRSNQSILKEVSPEYSQGGLMLKLKLPILWPPDVKNWLMWKDTVARKDWRQKEKGTTEDKMVGWHHWLDGHEFEKALGVGDGQGGLVCCSPWGGSQAWLRDWTETSLPVAGTASQTNHSTSYRDGIGWANIIMWIFGEDNEIPLLVQDKNTFSL